MSARAPAYPAPIELEEDQSPQVTSEAILRDPRERRYLSILSDHYSQLLSEMRRDISLLNYIGKVVYLIDADVVRNILDLSYADDFQRHETEKLFSNPDFNYAIPLGAFQELIAWMRKLVPSGTTIWSEEPLDMRRLGTNVFSASEAITRLARALNVPASRSNEQELMGRVASALEVANMRLDRLADLLLRPNCDVVIGDYDEEDAAAIN